jgi:hypothetical protein
MTAVTDNIQDLQSIVNLLTEEMHGTGLKINIAKTVLAANKYATDNSQITIREKTIDATNGETAFKYLGAQICLNGSNQLHTQYICDKAIKRAATLTKLKLLMAQAVTTVNSIIVPIIIYGAEVPSWTKKQTFKVDSTIATIFTKLTNVKREKMQCAIIFVKPAYRGLGVTHPSTTIYSNMIAQIHYQLQHRQAMSQYHYKTNQIAQNAQQMHSRKYGEVYTDQEEQNTLIY